MAPAPAWQAYADAILQRGALLCRLGDGRPPRDLAGMFVADQDVERILSTLPGLDGPAAELTEPLGSQLSATLETRRETFAQSLTEEGSRFARLVRAAQLDLDSAAILALIAAVELHPDRQRLVCYLQDHVSLPRLTLATIERLQVSVTGARLLAPDGRLRRCELVEVDPQNTWANRMTALPTRVAWYLQGDDGPDTALPLDVRFLPPTAPTAAWAAGPGDPGLHLVYGADRESRLVQARDVWPQKGVLIVSPPFAADAWPAVVREAVISDLVVVLETDSALDAAARAAIERADLVAWAVSSTRELPLELLPQRSWTEARVDDGVAGSRDWLARLGYPAPEGHRLDREQLRLVASAGRDQRLSVSQAVRRLAAGHLDELAVRITPRRGWDDLVLPVDQKRQLSELAARHRQRGTVYGDWGFPPLPSSGIVALFSGPSGTGKTLAAEVIAGDLELDLYKVDLSSVVSKYIGETEKNLGRIFEAAAAGDLVLFFDEADALFGKRTEVSDSHDRYANIEVSYLLQRLERYDGIVVMATNLQRNIDQAFLRRISIAVDFVLPDEAQRRVIWAASLPPTAPTHELDLTFLARNFKLSGGQIHNAVLAGAFLAAEKGQPITMEDLVLALKREFQKVGRLRTEGEFERYFHVIDTDDDATTGDNGAAAAR